MWFRCVWSALNVIATTPAGTNIASQIGSHQMITDKQRGEGRRQKEAMAWEWDGDGDGAGNHCQQNFGRFEAMRTGNIIAARRKESGYSLRLSFVT